MNHRSNSMDGRDSPPQRSQGSQQPSSRSAQADDRRDPTGTNAQTCPPGQRPITGDEEE